MTNLAEPQPCLLSMGRVIEQTFAVIRRHLPAMLFLAIMTFALAHWTTWIIDSLINGVSTSRLARTYHAIANMLALLPVMFISVLSAGAIAHRTLADMNGKPTSLVTDLRATARALISLVGIELGWIGLLFGGGLFIAVPGVLLRHTTAQVPVMLVFGVVVAVLFVATALAWAVVVPAVIAEKLGTMAAFRRSAVLTDGYRGQIFGLTVLIIVCVMVPLVIAFIIAGVQLPLHDPTGFSTPTDALKSFISIALSMVFPAGAAVIYSELLRVKSAGALPPQQMPQP